MTQSHRLPENILCTVFYDFNPNWSPSPVPSAFDQVVSIRLQGEDQVPTVVSPVPSLNVYQDDAGNIAGSFALPAATATTVTAINWTGLLQWLATYGPNVIAAITALIAVFGSSIPPAPAPAKHDVMIS